MIEDAFDVMGLPARFDLAQADIQRAYLNHAAATHPDHSAGEDDADVRSAVLNRARTVLEDPERRANVLLERLGGPGKTEDKSLPPGFLMSIMETREQVEEALASGDAAQRETWETWAQEQRGEYERRLGRLFDECSDSRDAVTLHAIRQELNAWRYIERLIEQLDPQYDPARRDFAD